MRRRANAWILLAAVALMCGVARLAAPSVPAERALPQVATSDVDGLVITDDGALIDINGANARLLMSLPGIGEVLAGRIVAHRAEHGPFHSVDELEQVQGIGKSRLDAVRGFVTCVIPE